MVNLVCVVSPAAEYHGVGGPLSVEDKSWYSPLLHGFLGAGHELGYHIIDPNGPEMIGEYLVRAVVVRDDGGSEYVVEKMEVMVMW